jgi:hemolysin III
MREATIGEEIFNSITHGVGAVAALAGLIILEIFTLKSGDGLLITATSIYGSLLFLLFLSSTLYHSIQAKRAKNILRVFDHVFIYFFIAGSYTPFLALVLRQKFSLGLTVMIIVWGLAIVGAIFKIFLINKIKLAKLDLLFYLFMGWFLVFILPVVVKVVSPENLLLLFIGGLFYTGGTVFYRWHKLKFHHAYWHIFVLLGSLTHYFAILKIS